MKCGVTNEASTVPGDAPKEKPDLKCRDACMPPHISQNRSCAGWGLFDLLCFIAACALLYPVARWASLCFPEHRRAIFIVIMATVYPAFGMLFCFLLHRLFNRVQHRRRRSFFPRQQQVKRPLPMFAFKITLESSGSILQP